MRAGTSVPDSSHKKAGSDENRENTASRTKSCAYGIGHTLH